MDRVICAKNGALQHALNSFTLLGRHLYCLSPRQILMYKKKIGPEFLRDAVQTL